MKKFIVTGILLLLVTLGTSIGLSVNSMSIFQSDLILKNIEALTQDEHNPSGTCGSYGWTGDSYVIVCDVSKSEALENFNWWSTPNKGWCCDSCPGSWYCGN